MGSSTSSPRLACGRTPARRARSRPGGSVPSRPVSISRSSFSSRTFGRTSGATSPISRTWTLVIATTRSAQWSCSLVRCLERWSRRLMPSSLMTRIASDVAGLPSIAHVPEEPTSASSTCRDSISWRNRASAIGDRHRLPVHTNNTLTSSSQPFSSLRCGLAFATRGSLLRDGVRECSPATPFFSLIGAVGRCEERGV
jgi:hypothetical protein